jgi:gag-polypeptide of LTR copia-type
MAQQPQKSSSNQPLTNFLLNGSNYLSWVCAGSIAQGGRSKKGHIVGASKPGDKKEEWRANNLSVMSWIFNSMEPSIYEIFDYSNTAKEVWDALHEMYDNVNNSSRIFEIQQEMGSLKQGSDQPFIEHFSKIKKCWEELRQYRPIATTVADYLKREEQERIFQLQASLSSDFEETQREILMRPELHSLITVCSIIQSEETRRRVMGKGSKVNSHNSENYAHYSNSVNTGDGNRQLKGKKGKKGGKYHRDHCKNSGHSRDRCWVLFSHLKPTKFKAGEALLAAQTESDQMQLKLDHLTKQVETLIRNGTATGSTSDSDPVEVTNIIKQHGKQLALSAISDSYIIVDSGATDNIFS